MAKTTGNASALVHHQEPRDDDPFHGWSPRPIRCQWLDGDEQTVESANVVRIVLDGERGSCEHWSNFRYQRDFFPEVEAFIGPSPAVIVSPAGTITTYVASLEAELSSLQLGLAKLQAALSQCRPGDREWLVGLDGCVPGESTPLQTVVHHQGETRLSAANTAVKLYPAPGEARTLVGSRLCALHGAVPPELATGRLASTSAGGFFVLVCADAVPFSRRSFANLRDEIRIAVRQHLRDVATTAPTPEYVLMATHWQELGTGGSFLNAANVLAEETGATVVTTFRAPKGSMAATAKRFAPVGPHAAKVATLLVYDT